MARYPSGYGWRRNLGRRLMYIIPALCIIAIVIGSFYRSSGKDRDRPDTPAADVKEEKETVARVVEPPKPAEPEPAPEPNLAKTSAEPVDESNPEADRLIAEAIAFINTSPRRIIEARDTLNRVLLMPVSEQQRTFVKGQLSLLADKWLFSRTLYPQDKLCGSYRVQAGDMLSTIGSQFEVPYEILIQINNIALAEALQAGQVIKVINGPFHARIYRSTFTMDLYLQNTFVRSFPVGLGKPGMETPTGLWLVKSDGKLIKPRWTDPITGRTYEPDNPNYPLGSRWIGLEGVKGDAVGRVGFAIHGTKDPDQIGTLGSQGCIRLHNGDAILMYELLMPGFSQVQVVE